MPTLSFPNSAFTLTQSAIWAFFALVMAIWIIATLVLEYHWKNYALDERKIMFVRLAYRTGSYFFLTIILLAAFFY